MKVPAHMKGLKEERAATIAAIKLAQREADKLKKTPHVEGAIGHLVKALWYLNEDNRDGA